MERKNIPCFCFVNGEDRFVFYLDKQNNKVTYYNCANDSTVQMIENYCSCKYIFCNDLHKKRFSVTISRTELATSNRNGCKNMTRKAINREFTRVFMSRSDKIHKTLLSSLACFSDYLQKLMKFNCGTRRLKKIPKV